MNDSVFNLNDVGLPHDRFGPLARYSGERDRGGRPVANSQPHRPSPPAPLPVARGGGSQIRGAWVVGFVCWHCLCHLPPTPSGISRTSPTPTPSRAQVVQRRRRLRGQPLRRRPAAGQADPDELRRRRAGSGSRPARSIRRSSPARRPTTRSSSSKTPTATARPTRPPSSPTACSSPPASSRATAAPTSPTAPSCSTSPTPNGDGKADQTPRRPLRLRHRGHAPHPPHASAGATTAGSTSTSRSTSTATSRRRTACAGSTAAASGSSGPRRMRARRLRPRLGQPLGPCTSTAGASRSSPTAPAARGSTTPSPAAYYVTAAGADARSCTGLNPGSPKYCGLEIVSGRHLPDDWQGDLHHQRLPRPPRLPLQAQRRRQPASPRREHARA